jgi:hypothetical protein
MIIVLSTVHVLTHIKEEKKNEQVFCIAENGTSKNQ